MSKKKSNHVCPNCPKCNSAEHIVKNGNVRGKQQWCCKNCRHYFIRESNKNKRISHFKYTDIRLLSVLLYVMGVKPKDILEYVIKPIKPDMNSEKVIYQWATKIIDGRVDARVKAELKIINISNFDRIQSKIYSISHTSMNNELRSYMVYVNLNNNEPNILIATNGIKQINETVKSPFWFSVLLQTLLIGWNNKEIYSIFNAGPDADIENKCQSNNSRNYSYVRYCTYGVNIGYKDEIRYSGEVKCANIEQQVLKKRQSKKEIGTSILLCFDSSFKAPVVYIFDKALYLTRH